MIDTNRRVLVVTAVVTAVFVASALDLGGLDPDNLPRDLALLALNTLPLLAIRRNPVVVVLVFCVAYPLWLDTGHLAHLFQSVPMLVGLYAAGGWSKPVWVRAIALVGPAWMMTAALTGQWADVDAVQIGYIAVMFVLAWALGAVIAGRRAYAAQLEEKTVALEAAQRELADRAVADERARIARELHDVIAHAMSVITVRAGVGSHLLGAGADRDLLGAGADRHLSESRMAEVARALAVIERTGREALAELRRMLAVLRDPDPRGPRPDPQPGLADLPRLVEQVEAGGVAVSLTTEGSADPLPAGLDLAAYRVVQEALTNVVKHEPGARASVTVRHRPEELEIEVRNPVRPAGPVVAGQGMRGMAERVSLYDGRFEAGPEQGEFRVSARFPLEGGRGGVS